LGDLVVFFVLAFFVLVAFLVPVVFFLGAAFLVVDLVEAAFLVVDAFLVVLADFLVVLAFLVEEEPVVDGEEPEDAAADAFFADFFAASPSANFCPVCFSTPLSTPLFSACRTSESLFLASRSA